jgi:hypothetical protein
LIIGGEKADEIFCVRSFSRSSRSDIAHTNHRYVKAFTSQYPAIEQDITHVYSQPIEPRERYECFAYFYVVSFHAMGDLLFTD